ncbi:MAG: hypothetical protein OEN50_07515, partial [Deltaproteobacteria bacterium]|nr:hypothetical protein [Deltaproteobacteria bacterium]
RLRKRRCRDRRSAARWHRARSSNADSHAWLDWMMEAANDKLKKAALTVVSELVKGDPREILIERATS